MTGPRLTPPPGLDAPTGMVVLHTLARASAEADDAALALVIQQFTACMFGIDGPNLVINTDQVRRIALLVMPTDATAALCALYGASVEVASRQLRSLTDVLAQLANQVEDARDAAQRAGGDS